MRIKAIRATIVAAAAIAVIMVSCGKSAEWNEGEDPTETDFFTGTYTLSAYVTDHGAYAEYPGLEFTVTKKGAVYGLKGGIPASGGAISLELALTDAKPTEKETLVIYSFTIPARDTKVGNGLRTLAGTGDTQDPGGNPRDCMVYIGNGQRQLILGIAAQDAGSALLITLTNMY